MIQVDSVLEEIFFDNVLVNYELLSMVYSWQAQFQLDNKRYDFALEVVKDRWILIECDSEAWHSNGEQMRNDEAKDKLASSAGMSILRFDYWEIVEDAESVANEIEAMIDLLKY